MKIPCHPPLEPPALSELTPLTFWSLLCSAQEAFVRLMTLYFTSLSIICFPLVDFQVAEDRGLCNPSPTIPKEVYNFANLSKSPSPSKSWIPHVLIGVNVFLIAPSHWWGFTTHSVNNLNATQTRCSCRSAWTTKQTICNFSVSGFCTHINALISDHVGDIYLQVSSFWVILKLETNNDLTFFPLNISLHSPYNEEM